MCIIVIETRLVAWPPNSKHRTAPISWLHASMPPSRYNKNMGTKKDSVIESDITLESIWTELREHRKKRQDERKELLSKISRLEKLLKTRTNE